MYNTSFIQIQKGDIFYADLGDTVGSEESGIRPVLIMEETSSYCNRSSGVHRHRKA